ncbi:outer membrane beta-barrel protein [Patiriisocius sp. Uisw_047]|uniref:outer membrane beta-barrel protein n=1 Tax=Patiriisocius sp. Uisw_047 TaxID=3230969 RepID=UPI0039E8FFE6
MQSKDNKNIDQLFKSRLQGMETPPPPAVWENIQVALGHNKRDRKVIPLWWKLSGVAAALVLLFSVANLFMSDTFEDNHNNQLVIEDVTQSSQEQGVEKFILVNQNLENSNITSENTTDVIDSSVKNTSDAHKPNVVKTANRFMNTSVAAKSTIKDDAVKQNNITKQISEKLLSKNSVAAKTPNERINNDIKTEQESSHKAETLLKKNLVATSPFIDEVAIENVAIVKEGIQKESIFNAIEEQKEAVAKTTDGLPINRWAISPNVAPVYYSSLSQGSSIDPTFADNTQNGEVNVSYGINVSYALTQRLTVRSGVSNVNLSYATGGLELATGDANAALQSVNFNDKGTVVTAIDQGALIDAAEGSNFDNLTRKVTDGDVFLTQSISYTEIPAELTYALVNKRLGVSLIGGFSTLLLGTNEVSVSANDFEDVIGEANNLSDVSFSTNVGVGLSYQLSRKFKFNVEPMFKYQLNPYTDASVQFKPYYVGIYSGLSFKF